MNRLLFLGDIHGNPIWKKILEENKGKYDKILFVGDYVDSYEFTAKEQAKNLAEIIELKKSDPENVVLLIGNHDVQYLTRYNQGLICISDLTTKKFKRFNSLFRENINLFQLAFAEKDHVFTHAGIHQTWFDEYIQYKKAINNPFIFYTDYEPQMSLAIELVDKLNEDYKTFLKSCLPGEVKMSRDLPMFMDVGRIRGGRSIVGGPLWYDRRNSQKYDGLPSMFSQVAGHTKSDEIIENKVSIRSNTASLYSIDIFTKNRQDYEPFILEFNETKFSEIWTNKKRNINFQFI